MRNPLFLALASALALAVIGCGQQNPEPVGQLHLTKSCPESGRAFDKQCPICMSNRNHCESDSRMSSPVRFIRG